MISARIVALVAVALLLTPVAALSQSGLFDSIEIKKRFDGGKEEQEPAQIAFAAPDGWDSRYLLVDAAARFNLKSFRSGRTTMFLAPVIDYHRSNAEPLRRQRAIHQLAPAMTFESYFDPEFAVKPNLMLKASATRNLVDDTFEGAFTGFVSVYSLERFGPGRAIAVRNHRLMRYVPSLGFEHFKNLAIKGGNVTVAEPFSGSFATFRLFVQFYPFNRAIRADDIRFSIEADGHIRQRLGTQTAVDRTLDSLSAGATWYFVSRQRVGLGLSGEFGQTPATNFVDQRRVVLALRVKLAPGS